MSKRCSRCEKVVYPIEELKCLDKIWHKGCFKCQECNMTLSMKTYKGFNKLPYCEAHIPKAKATTVAETPEMKRLAANTKIQSNVQYHADFEKNKARFTQVADDPETLRLKQNSRNISMSTYHGDVEKKAKMESQRQTSADSVSPELLPPEKVVELAPASQHIPQQMTQKQPPSSQYSSASAASRLHQQQYNRMPQPQQSNNYYRDHSTPHTTNYHSQSQHLHQVMPSHQPHPQKQSVHHIPTQHHQSMPQQYHQQHQPYHNPNPQTYPYQDTNRNAPSQYGARPSQTLIYSSQTGPVNEATENVGSIADYDPLNNQYGSNSVQGRNQTGPGYRTDSNKGQRGHYHQAPQMVQHQKINAPPTNLGRCYRAIFDYEAADCDEVSFKDGDLIVNCTSIDEGWMTGTVQRSGRVGMLPANYVQRTN